MLESSKNKGCKRKRVAFRKLGIAAACWQVSGDSGVKQVALKALLWRMELEKLKSCCGFERNLVFKFMNPGAWCLPGGAPAHDRGKLLTAQILG